MVWGGLHFVIVPRIAEFRPALEQQASHALGVTVRVGGIVARSNGLIPSLELNDVRLYDAQGRETLKLPQVLAALSARSLMGLGLEQLTVDSPELDVRRSPDGRIWIAGIPVSGEGNTDSAGADWVFSQPELVIRHGTVTWTDELRGVPPLALTDVDWVLRNQHRTHAMRLDANPPPHWGQRLSVAGIFRQPLLSRRASLWREWQGQVYANFAQVDLAELRRYADLGVDLVQGAGSLRAWVDVNRGEVSGATADLALDGVRAILSPQLEALTLRGISGRLGARRVDGGGEFSTQALQFETEDGLRWPGGNVRLTLAAADARKPAHGELVADRLDLAAMAQIAQRLPLPEDTRLILQQLAPKGLVEQLQASWQGPPEQPSRYSARGRVAHLELAPRALEAGFWPGLHGADIDFDLTQSGGKATMALKGGSIDLPGVFDDPVLRMDQLNTDVQWKLDGAQISLSLPNLRFANGDAQGDAQVKWQTADTAAGASRFPGLLDLQGSMSRAEGTKVHRYLPLGLPKDVRDYVREAVVAGTASGVRFKVKGNLHDFPYTTPKQGDFRISADVHDATFAYVPPFLLPKDNLQWPALTQLSGELVIDRAVLQVKGAHGSVAGSSGLRVTKADGVIDSLYGGATVTVTTEAQGPLTDVLGVVNGSPLGGLMGKALDKASAAGAADYRFRLAFPIAAVDKATVRGSVVLANDELQITPDTPRLARARGTIAFSETGFSLSGVQARALGGDVRIEGGLSGFGSTAASAAGGKSAAPQVLRLQGTATADGLRQARELGLVARLGQYGNGTAAYNATVGWRGGVPEVQVTSNLVGMALALPAPFTKTAEATLPLKLDLAAVRALASTAGETPVRMAQDQLQLDVGKQLSVVYVRDVSGAEARVLRGAIGVGLAADESAPLPAEGVVANVNLGTLDADAWSNVLSQATGTDLAVTNFSSVSGAAPSTGYLPTSLAVRARADRWRAQAQQRGHRRRARGQPVACQCGCHRIQRLCRIPPAQRRQRRTPVWPPGAPRHRPQRRAGCGERARRAAGQHPRAGHRGGGPGAARQEARTRGDRCRQPGGFRQRRGARHPARMAAQPLQHHHARGGAHRQRQLGQHRHPVRRATAPQHQGAPAHRVEFQARHRRCRPVAQPLWHEGRGAQGPGQGRGPGGLAGLAHHAGLPQPERQLQHQRRDRPVPQDRSGHWQAAERAQPAVAAAPAHAGLPRRVQRGLCLRPLPRRRHHRPGHCPHQQPADEGRHRRRADGGPGRHRPRDAEPQGRGGA